MNFNLEYNTNGHADIYKWIHNSNMKISIKLKQEKNEKLEF